MSIEFILRLSWVFSFFCPLRTFLDFFVVYFVEVSDGFGVLLSQLLCPLLL